MSKTPLLFILLLFGATCVSMAQEESESRESYYEARAREDAAYEMSLKENEEDEAEFWESQENYEKALKKMDKKAYRAYMRGKRDAYREHAYHCGSHCHHGPHYEYRATYYYSDYHPGPSRQAGLGVRVRSPRIRIGL